MIQRSIWNKLGVTLPVFSEATVDDVPESHFFSNVFSMIFPSFIYRNMVSMLSHGPTYPTMGPSIPLPLHQAMVVRELVVEVEAWSCWLVGWLVGSSSISSVGFQMEGRPL